MRVRYKKCHENAQEPKYASSGDACLDLFASSFSIDDFGNVTYDTGIALEIPEDHVGLVFPRSSVFKKDLMLKNSVGVIDSGYRGTIQVKFVKQRSSGAYYSVGDRVAQIMIIPRPSVTLEEVDELSGTSRGAGGFGSTGS
jgi:dUTP pyrophosphatase